MARPSLGNHANRRKRLFVLMVITLVQEPVSALQENDVSWIFVDSRSACPPTLRMCHSSVAQQEWTSLNFSERRKFASNPTTAHNSDDHVGRRGSPVPDGVSQTSAGARFTKWSWRRSTRTSKSGVDGMLLCAMDDVEMRALQDRAERLGPSASSSSTQPVNIREEFTHAETHGQRSGSTRSRKSIRSWAGRTQRNISPSFGVGVSTALERCQTCHTRVAARIVACPKREWTIFFMTARRTAS